MSEPTPIVEPVVKPVTPDPIVEPEPQMVPVSESIKYRKRAQEAEAALESARKKSLSDDQLSEYETLRKQAEDTVAQKLVDQGNYDELLAKKQEAMDKAVDAEKSEKQAALAAFKQVAVTGPIMQALAAKGVKDVKSAAYLLQGQYEQQAEAELIDGQAVVKVRDRNGNLIQDANCDPNQSITVEQLVDGWLATSAGQNYLPASGDSGTGTHVGGTPKQTDSALIAELDGSPDKKAAYIQEHGGDAYVKLAGNVRRQRKLKETI